MISPELYGLPVGGTGRYAIGMHEQATRRRCSSRCEPVDRIECVSLFAPWLDARGDGFLALRAGRVTAFSGEQR